MPIRLKRANSLRIPWAFPRPGSVLLQPSSKQLIHLNGGPFSEQTQEYYRSSWLKAIQENPGTGVRDLMNKFQKVYRWLYNYDRLWQKAHLPQTPKPSRKWETIVNWNERDRQTAEAVKAVALQIKDSKGIPERLTKTSILRRVEKGASLARYLSKGKLPRTEQMLNHMVESSEEFVIRRIWWVRNIYLREKLALPTRSFFARQTGAEEYNSSPKVRGAFDAAMQSLEAFFLSSAQDIQQALLNDNKNSADSED